MYGRPSTSGAARERTIPSPRSGGPPNYPSRVDEPHAHMVGAPLAEPRAEVPIADKERFFAHISHELRTPANVVLGYSDLLSDGAGGVLPTKAAEMVGRIARSARHLRGLVDDILDLTRLETGLVTLVLEEQSLATLLRDTLVMTPGELERVFEDFYQAGAHNGGSGLGLAISRRLARLLGGDLSVESTPGEGSSFTLTLPTRS